MSAEQIQQARDVLATWREEATAGQRIVDLDRGESFGSVDTPDVYGEGNADSVVLPAGTVGEHDIPLIVGTAGNPELLDAIDAVLEAGCLRFGDVTSSSFTGGYRRSSSDTAERLAAAIIAADERMSR